MKTIKLLFLIFFVVSISNTVAQTVYITDTGKKYHKTNCRYLKSSKSEIALEKAQKRNFTACKVCKPQAGIANKKAKFNTKSKKNTSTSIASQCTGETKSGARCKRKTKSSSGKCYQH